MGALPLLEIRIHQPVRETFAANTDAFQYTVASQLIQHQSRIDDTALLQLVGDDTTNEVRMSRFQHAHQVVQAFLKWQ